MSIEYVHFVVLRKCVTSVTEPKINRVIVYSLELLLSQLSARIINAFKLYCQRKLLRVPWTAWRSNQSILKGINPEYSLEGLMLKLKLWWPDGKNWLTGKDPDAGKNWRQAEKQITEDEMVGWHHWFDGHEFEEALGVGDGQGSLECCSPIQFSSVAQPCLTLCDPTNLQSMGLQRVGHNWVTELK